MNVDGAESLEDIPEEAAVVQALKLIDKKEFLDEDVANIARELGDVVHQIVMDLAGFLPARLVEGKAGKVMDLRVVVDGVEQHHVAGGLVHAVRQVLGRAQNGVFGRLQDIIEAAQHDEGQDYLTVFRSLEIAAKDFGDLPDKAAQIPNVLFGYRSCAPFSSFVRCKPNFRLKVDQVGFRRVWSEAHRTAKPACLAAPSAAGHGRIRVCLPRRLLQQLGMAARAKASARSLSA